MQEIWKDVIGYEGLYQVSNLGRIKSLTWYDGRNGKVIKRERILKTSKKNNAYSSVTLCDKTSRKYISVHKLVAEAFIPNPNKYKEINHKDGNKQNNFVDNLEWITHSENLLHAYNSGLSKNNKKIRQYSLQGEFIKEWNSSCEVERTLKFSHSLIIACCRGKRKTAYKYIWKYKDIS